MQKRYQHRQEVVAFLGSRLGSQSWELTLPPSGRGHETYLAQGGGKRYFIKLGAYLPRYQVMASLGLTPAVVEAGRLEDGTSILVQEHVMGRNPSWRDFRDHLPEMAAVVKAMHHSPALQAVLPASSTETYKDAGLAALERVRQKWAAQRTQVPAVANEVDEMLARLGQEAESFAGLGLVASHNDICNGNWLIADDGNVYLVDLEAMSRDDPAHDMGALLWWYYPPELRPGFLERAGHPQGEAFRQRMRVRMALHCLDILLPRAGSYDRFDAHSFAEALTDFRAVFAGRENPHGYEDRT